MENLKQKICGVLITCLLLMQLTPVVLAEEEESIPPGITVQNVYNGAPVTNVKEGDVFAVRFILSEIAPITILLPLRWDPEIVEVIDSKTGNTVTSGRKFASDMLDNSGLKVGEKCYDKSEDIAGMKLYWNGLPQFSETPPEEEGYPYLNQETGLYKVLYYVYLPTEPVKPQTFLEISFRAKKSGDPNLHFATKAEVDEMEDVYEPLEYYDIAAPNGLETLHNDENGEAVVEVYTERTLFPPLRIITDEDINNPPEEPKPAPVVPDDSGSSSSGGGGGGGGYEPGPDESDEPEEPVEPTYDIPLVPTEHLDDIFPYTSADKLKTNLMPNADMVIDEHSVYTVTQGTVADYLNELENVPKSVIFALPDEIPERDEHVLSLDGTILNYLYGAGIPMMYVETPWGYVGINPAVLFMTINQEAPISIYTEPSEDGISVRIESESGEVNGFYGNLLRIILPYTKDDTQSSVVVTSPDVFGAYEAPAQQLPIQKYDAKSGALVFLAPCTGSFEISELEKQEFTDLESVPWAQEAVNGLANASIVNGTGNGTFSPDDNVTREQFAKMIVSATGMYQTELLTGFTDIAEDSVFYPYIVSANQAGLVNGVSNKEFAPTDNISREDLATICYRAVQLMGIELEQKREETLFADDSAISEYAHDAVYALYRAGIIDGTGSGFDPKGNTSRAAAAKILYGIFAQLNSLI